MARLPLLAPLLAACSPANLVNALTPRGGYTVTRDLRFREGDRGTLDLYTPDGATDATPVVVFFYGGGWKDGTKGSYRFLAQSLTSLGMVVAIPDYRLYPEVRWPTFLEDAAAATRFLQTGVAANRPMVLMGHSAGAFIVGALATDPRWLGRASRRSLRGAIGLAGPYDFQPEEAEYVAIFRDAPGGRARVLPAEPGDLNGCPPTLLLHGLADDTVSPERSRELARSLRAANIPVTLREYPDVGHIGIIGALAAPVRGLGLAGAPVRDDVAEFLNTVVPRGAPA
ncbi:alpha/beta hydrolase [Roseomonas elaeocarpi]|uniref:Alpha/beta hydrolase n=1 Tax=Roseomonas elaeocarpi TaxID=907779 RepID=A0ABV6JTL9_9PROT